MSSRKKPPGVGVPRPGYVLIFRPWFRTKSGRIVRHPRGGVFPLWVRSERS